MRYLFIFFCFLLIGGLLILSNQNLSLIIPDNLVLFSSQYYSWLDLVYSNFSVLFSNLLEMNWF